MKVRGGYHSDTKREGEVAKLRRMTTSARRRRGEQREIALPFHRSGACERGEKQEESPSVHPTGIQTLFYPSSAVQSIVRVKRSTMRTLKGDKPNNTKSHGMCPASLTTRPCGASVMVFLSLSLLLCVMSCAIYICHKTMCARADVGDAIKAWLNANLGEFSELDRWEVDGEDSIGIEDCEDKEHCISTETKKTGDLKAKSTEIWDFSTAWTLKTADDSSACTLQTRRRVQTLQGRYSEGGRTLPGVLASAFPDPSSLATCPFPQSDPRQLCCPSWKSEGSKIDFWRERFAFQEVRDSRVEQLPCHGVVPSGHPPGPRVFWGLQKEPLREPDVPRVLRESGTYVRIRTISYLSGVYLHVEDEVHGRPVGVSPEEPTSDEVPERVNPTGVLREGKVRNQPARIRGGHQPDWDTNLDLSVNGSLDYCESDALDHAATKTRHWIVPFITATLHHRAILTTLKLAGDGLPNHSTRGTNHSLLDDMVGTSFLPHLSSRQVKAAVVRVATQTPIHSSTLKGLKAAFQLAAVG
uniref:Transmembrane protein n=1 Tax=Timema tahoe TaxID=61484 RepID=A0A7R9IL91_9NEOP|nr:unnamed protein product [Timema tahoe]